MSITEDANEGGESIGGSCDAEELASSSSQVATHVRYDLFIIPDIFSFLNVLFFFFFFKTEIFHKHYFYGFIESG